MLKNTSNQLLVLGIFSFSIKDNVASRSFFRLFKNFVISSGKNCLLLYNVLNFLFASLIVSDLNIFDIALE